MTTYYRADFASGHVEVRRTERRTYIACVACNTRKQLCPERYRYVRWCASHQRANSELGRAQINPRVFHAEISRTVTKITAEAYRALKQAT